MVNITLSQGAILDVSGNGGGTVRIRGGQFLMDQSAVVANTNGVNEGDPDCDQRERNRWSLARQSKRIGCQSDQCRAQWGYRNHRPDD